MSCSRKNKEACDKTCTVRLNLVLRADVAKALKELKSRGLIRSYADGVNQAIRAFYTSIKKEELLSARLKALQSPPEEDYCDNERKIFKS
ncbi:MAG: hypothetical protein QXV37_02140 [Candidatus Jordarchaeaceae archaeon]